MLTSNPYVNRSRGGPLNGSEPARHSSPGSIAIVGGGICGLCTAYFLREEGFEGRITIVERDRSRSRSSTARSVAALRHQFHLEINVALSLFSSSFFATFEERFGRSIGYERSNYLVLAGPDGAERLQEANENQKSAAADVEYLAADGLVARFPWLKTAGLGGATYGVSGEGWIDPVAAIETMQDQLERMSVDLVFADATRFRSNDGVVSAICLADGRQIEADVYVNAAGPQAGRLMESSGAALPVESKKRCAFVFESDDPPIGYPCLVDPTIAQRSIFSRPYGGHFLAVTSPDPSDDPHTDDLEVDLPLFEELIRPGLARRVHGFEDIRLVNSWAGHYEVNTFDQNALIGLSQAASNLYLICGFSGHGVMHAPGAGRGLSELILTGSYRALDLTPFDPARVMADRRLDDLQPSEHREVQAGI